MSRAALMLIRVSKMIVEPALRLALSHACAHHGGGGLEGKRQDAGHCAAAARARGARGVGPEPGRLDNHCKRVVLVDYLEALPVNSYAALRGQDLDHGTRQHKLFARGGGRAVHAD